MKAHANHIFRAMPSLIGRDHKLSLAHLRSIEYTLSTGLYADPAAEIRAAINILQKSNTDDAFEEAIARSETAIGRLYFSESDYDAKRRKEYLATLQ